jgi:hypothetical protein
MILKLDAWNQKSLFERLRSGLEMVQRMRVGGWWWGSYAI